MSVNSQVAFGSWWETVLHAARIKLLNFSAFVWAQPEFERTNTESKQRFILGEINAYRKAAQSKSMLLVSWDTEAEAQAQKWADRCEFRRPSSDQERTQYLTTSSKYVYAALAIICGKLSSLLTLRSVFCGWNSTNSCGVRWPWRWHGCS